MAEGGKSWWKSLAGWASALLFLAGTVNVAIGTHAAFGNQLDRASICLLAGLVFLFAATIERFEFLKGFGVEARTRTLDRKIEEADRALAGLRQLGEVAGSALLDVNSKMGRWDSAPTPSQNYAFAERVRHMLKSLGSDEETIARALHPWAKGMAGDLCAAIISPAREAVRAKEKALYEARQAIPSPWQPGNPDLLRIQGELERTHSALETLNTYRFPLSELPDGLYRVIDEAESVLEPGALSLARRKADDFAYSLRTLRDTNQLPNAQRAIDEIDRYIESMHS